MSTREAPKLGSFADLLRIKRMTVGEGIMRLSDARHVLARHHVTESFAAAIATHATESRPLADGRHTALKVLGLSAYLLSGSAANKGRVEVNYRRNSGFGDGNPGVGDCGYNLILPVVGEMQAINMADNLPPDSWHVYYREPNNEVGRYNPMGGHLLSGTSDALFRVVRAAASDLADTVQFLDTLGEAWPNMAK